MANVRLRRQTEHDVDVAEAEVAIDDGDAMAQAAQRHRHVDREVRLAHSTFAAGHGEDEGAFQGPRIAHAQAPAIVSPSTQSVSVAAVARWRSSGTFWPCARYDTGNFDSLSTLISGASVSAS